MTKKERKIFMKKFSIKKFAVMSLAAMMTVSAMSVSAFAENNIDSNDGFITEVGHTYITNDQGETELVNFNVDVPVDATEEEKDELFIRAAYAKINDMMPMPTYDLTIILSKNNFSFTLNGENGDNPGSILGTTATAAGSNGLAVVLSNVYNFSRYNISFCAIDSTDLWYELNLAADSGTTVFFTPNGKMSTAMYNHDDNTVKARTKFTYNSNKKYTVGLSANSRFEPNVGMTANVKIYSY